MSRIDPNRLCPACLNEMPQRGFPCPFCGYQPDTAERSPRCLPPYTILAGRYLVGTVLGEGGFGITYRGWDLEQDRKIAIKEYFPSGLVTRDTSHGGDNTVQSISGQMRVHYKAGLEKYENEARCLMSLKGTPGIVDILSFFHENGTAYIIMEFIEGVTLRKYLAGHNACLPEQQTLEMFRPLLFSLEAVHNAGIVHRDISPDNIIVQPDGSLKLIDFGAARQSTGEATQSLTVILKHGYAPEEQYRSRSKQGPFTDIYAISATIYKTLTGVTPVDAMSRMFEDELKPLDQYPNRISPQTCAAIQKGMAVRAVNRYQTVKELAASLYEKELTVEPTLAMPVAKRKHSGKMLALIAGGVAVCAILILTVMSLTKAKPEQSLSWPQPSQEEPAAPEEPSDAELPDFLGKSEADAKAGLEALGIYVTVMYAPADGAHAGTVLSFERTSAQSVTLTVGELTPYTFRETEEGLELTGTSSENEFLDLPDTINGIPVVSIGDYAFAEDTGEERVVYQVSFPAQLQHIGEGAFSGCLFLGEIRLPDTVTEIGDGAFWSCSAVSVLELPSGLRHVGNYAFQYCYGLPEIVLPDGCQTVGEQAFEGCFTAEKIVLPASLTEIGPGAFTGCDAATVYVTAGSYGEAYAQESDLPYISVEPGNGALALNYQSVNFTLAGMQIQLEAVGIPAGEAVLFQSSDILVATVTDGGLVTAVSNGEAVIRATWESGELTCSIHCNFIADPSERYVDTLGYRIAKAKKPTIAVSPFMETSEAFTGGKIVLACRNDGTCSYAESYYDSRNGTAHIEKVSQVLLPGLEALDEWNSVISVAVNYLGLYGLRADGTVVGICSDYTLASNAHNSYVVTGYEEVHEDVQVSEWNNIVAIYTWNDGIAGLKSDGTVVRAWGKSSYESDGTPVWKRRTELFPDWNDIVEISGHGDNCLLGVRADGQILVYGGYIKYWSEYTSEWHEIDIKDTILIWKNIEDIHASSFYVAGIEAGGAVILNKLDESGYCSLTAGDVADWQDIVSIAASDSILVGLKSDGTVVSAVNHGNYLWKSNAGEYTINSNLDTWENVVAIESDGESVIGLRADGTVMICNPYDLQNEIICRSIDIDCLTNIRIPE